MTKAWNLTPEEWSNVLLQKITPEGLANNVKNGAVFPWAENLLQFTQDSKEILDLGSGRGEHSALLALHGKKTTLLDWSQENLDFSGELFKTMGVDGKFVRADMTKPLPFESGSFDTVFSCGVFEYFSDGQIRDILKETLRISRKRVIIMIPNAFSIAYRIGKWYLEKTNKWPWGGERPSRTLIPYFQTGKNLRLVEFSVGFKHSLNFLLPMPAGGRIKNLMARLLRLKDHSRPALFRQGYLLITVAEKS